MPAAGDTEPSGPQAKAPASGRTADGTTVLPEPGANYNPGPPVEPRQAATVILLRGGDETLEVLLVQRTPQARFLGGMWVFPGGAVDAHEGEGDEAHRAAAVRELHEEAGIDVGDPAGLVKFSRWITPAQVQVRFDTHFFLAPLPEGQEPAVDGEECVDLGWFTPEGAIEAYREGTIPMIFPTIKQLEQLGGFATVDELIEHARGQTVEPVEPRVVLEGEVARILLPGDEGY